ncbi:MAG: lipid-binding SYLF domain-containing protein [Phycisphaerae bacterium]
MVRIMSLFAILALSLCAFTGCSTAPQTAEGKADIIRDANVTIAQAKSDDASFAHFLQTAYGYAVFPSIGKGAIGLGGAYGKGVLFEQESPTGYCDVSQGTIGFQLGGQAYSEVIVFATKAACNEFKTGHFTFDAQATAVALKSGAGTNAKYTGGVAVFTMAETGLMFEAAIGGQKFSYLPK